MIRFNGSVTAISPITVSYPVDKKTGGDDHQLPRNQHGEVVIFGNTFRGPLRKAAYRAVRRILAARNGVDEAGVFSLAQAYMLAQGVDVTRGVNNESSNSADPVAEQRLRHLNPMLNLFGRWRLPSRLSVGELRAPEEAAMIVGGGARTDMFERNTEEALYLSLEDRDLLIQQLESERASHLDIDKLKSDMKAIKREAVKCEDPDQKKALFARVDELERDIKEAKASRKGAQESIKHPLSGFEAIESGTRMTHQMTLPSGNEVELGLLLVSLAEMAINPYLGGHRNIGCGQFEAEWEVSRWEAGSLKPEVIGTVKINVEGVEIIGDGLTQAYAGFTDRFDEFDFSVNTLEAARAA